MTYPPPSFCRPERASLRRARLVWLVALVGLLVLSVLATIASMSVIPHDSPQQSTEIVDAGPAQQDVREGDPPGDLQHRESPAKKPRFKSVLIQTADATDAERPLAFHLRAADASPIRHFTPRHPESCQGTRRNDPTLRLHPGQAPPRVA